MLDYFHNCFGGNISMESIKTAMDISLKSIAVRSANPNPPVTDLSEGQLQAYGPYDANFMIVGSYPYYRDMEMNMPFSDYYGLLTLMMLDKQNIDRESVFMTTVFKDRNYTSNGDMNITLEEFYYNMSKHTLPEIERVKPHVLLIMGETSCRTFKELFDIPHENLSWDECRTNGDVIKYKGTTTFVLYTIDPVFILNADTVSHKNIMDILWRDIEKSHIMLMQYDYLKQKETHS